VFNRILIPVDFTSKNVTALRASRSMVRGSRAQITLLHVIERIAGLATDEVRPFYKKLERAATKKLETWSKRFPKGIEIRKEILYGNRAREIVRYATDRKMDLIVLSSHKVNPADPVTGWGTTSHKVAILSQCPVLLIK
jgi:nucleotide-binding universal stress UspA family protein